MHSSAVFRGSDFELKQRGREISHGLYFADFASTDRLGLFAPLGCEGAGAGVLIMAYVTAFYDRYRAAGSDFFAYPDFFSFQRRLPPASYSMFDIWPGHKDVTVPESANETATAITDRAVNILLVPERASRACEFERVQQASLERNVRRCLLFGEDGIVDDPTLEVATKAQPIRDWTEAMIDSTAISPEANASAAATAHPDATAARATLVAMEGDVVRQTFREINLDEALARL